VYHTTRATPPSHDNLKRQNVLLIKVGQGVGGWGLSAAVAGEMR